MRRVADGTTLTTFLKQKTRRVAKDLKKRSVYAFVRYRRHGVRHDLERPRSVILLVGFGRKDDEAFGSQRISWVLLRPDVPLLMSIYGTVVGGGRLLLWQGRQGYQLLLYRSSGD